MRRELRAGGKTREGNAEAQRAQRREGRREEKWESMFDGDDERGLAKAAAKLAQGFGALPEFTAWKPDEARLGEVLALTAERLRDNYPYFHPLYAGQMLKPPHPVARLAYALAMNINPNNHALDGGRATSAMEKEAVGEIAAMFGWKSCLGHLCGGGTMANCRLKRWSAMRWGAWTSEDCKSGSSREMSERWWRRSGPPRQGPSMRCRKF